MTQALPVRAPALTHRVETVNPSDGSTGWATLQEVADAVQADLVTDAVYVAYTQTINAQTGTSYTLVAGDVGKLVTLSNGSAITLSVPADADAVWAIGRRCELMQLGAGQVTVAAGSGATLRKSGATAKALQQYSRLFVQKIAADTWSMWGEVAAS